MDKSVLAQASLTIYKYLSMRILPTLVKMYNSKLKKEEEGWCILTWKAIKSTN